MFLTALQTPNRVISLRGCVVSRMSEPTLLRGPQRYPSRGAWGRVCLCGGKGRGAAVVMKIDMQTDRLRGYTHLHHVQLLPQPTLGGRPHALGGVVTRGVDGPGISQIIAAPLGAFAGSTRTSAAPQVGGVAG